MAIVDEKSSEISKRRTFAIISHPDAGKTTLTEKLLLFGGAIQLAGTVKGRKAARHATSDWMRLEQQRGISVTSSVMQFPFNGRIVNLLDTPGHEDFSEDTYRTLTAVDSALMVIDCAKGVEERTIRLMEVCRLRATPIMTFINKLDREGRAPLDLLDEIEKVLKLHVAPVTWPIGMGRELMGIYHLAQDRIYAYEAGARGTRGENRAIDGLMSDEASEFLGDRAAAFREEVELVRGAATQFDVDEYLAGRQTPVFFGSAISNFGVEELLTSFTEHAPGAAAARDPRAHGAAARSRSSPASCSRSRRTWIRAIATASPSCASVPDAMRPACVSSIRGWARRLRVADALTFMAGERSAAEEAWAGDIIGLHNHGTINIGDTFTEGEKLGFTGIPNFAPELFRRAVLKDPLKMKALQKGLNQLCEEGATQLFRPVRNNDLILGAVGQLQFEVVAFRLQDEYGVQCAFEGNQCADRPLGAGRGQEAGRVPHQGA